MHLSNDPPDGELFHQTRGKRPLNLATSGHLLHRNYWIFILVGFLFALLMGDNPAYFSGHWLTNLVIGLVFLILGASLLGVFFLRLPSSFLQFGGSRNGYGGALLMGLAFAIISFTCTAPFAGLVLGAAASGGSWGTAVIGMAVYASVIALPFSF